MTGFFCYQVIHDRLVFSWRLVCYCCSQVSLDMLGLLGFCWNSDICFFYQVLLPLDMMGCVVSDSFCSIVIRFRLRFIC